MEPTRDETRLSPKRWSRVKDIVAEAMELAPSERAAFLDRACADDSTLRGEVESLLAREAHASRLLVVPDRGEIAGLLQEHHTDSNIGRRIGGFEITAVLGYGGMGVVYRALQQQPRREVALKVMRQGIASRGALRRFEYEGQVLARLRHPGIAQIYQAGVHRDDQGVAPYFAMEEIPNAKPLTKYAADKNLSTRARMKLFAEVCEAVHHGHQKGVIHRDLKPSNILVDPATGSAKIIDFGVARSTNSDLAVTTMRTDVGQLIGTLQYMSPEQCQADPHDIDTRSDVYSLGVVLYELLVGRLPYDVGTGPIHEATRMVREATPPRPSTVNRALRGDAETIVLKALEKERERRYESAAALAQDIERYLNNESIVARPASVAYQIRVFARRHRALVASVCVIFAVLAGATVVSTALYFRATGAERRASREAQVARDAQAAAEEQQQIAEQNEARAVKEQAKAQGVSKFLENMLASVDPEFGRGKDVTVRQVLDASAASIRGETELDSEVECAVRRVIGNTYKNLGAYADAAAQFKRVIELDQSLFGPDDGQTIVDEFWLALNYYQDGRVEDAITLYQRVVPRGEAVLGPDNSWIVFAKNELANAYLTYGDVARAGPLLAEAVASSTRVNGPRHVVTGTAELNLGRYYSMLGRHEDAKRVLQSSLKTYTRFSSTSPFTARVTQVLARAHLQAGEFADAERLAANACAIVEGSVGTEHRDYRRALEARASALEGLGRFADAEAAVATLLNAMQRQRGDLDTTTLAFVNWQSRLAQKQGAVDRARASARAYLHRCREALASEDAGAEQHRAMAEVLMRIVPADLRSPSEALEHAERAFELADPPGYFELCTLAKARFLTGEFESAVAALRKVELLLPEGESTLRNTWERLSLYVLSTGGEDAAAEQMARSIIERKRAGGSDDDPSLDYPLFMLGKSLARRGRLDEAWPYLRQWLESKRAVPGYEEARLPWGRRRFGVSMAGLAFYDELARWRRALTESGESALPALAKRQPDTIAIHERDTQP